MSEPTPQDGVPWNPEIPPPTSPPKSKKKRWPWIVAAVIVFCGLPLGGCVALIGLGVNEINQRNDAIQGTVDDFFDASSTGQSAVASAKADGDDPCMSRDDVVASTSDLGSGWDWSISSTSFVDRSEGTTFSSNADPETLFVDGRPNEGTALVRGEVKTTSGDRDFEILLSKPLSSWRICTIVLR